MKSPVQILMAEALRRELAARGITLAPADCEACVGRVLAESARAAAQITATLAARPQPDPAP